MNGKTVTITWTGGGRTPEELRPGHEIKRQIKDSPAYHHGIYVGDDEGIAQVVDRNDGQPPALVPMSSFLNGESKFFIVVYTNDQAVARADTVLMAKLLVGDEHWAKERYNLIFNNCEHMTKYCRTGWNGSMQVIHACGRGIMASSGSASVGVSATCDVVPVSTAVVSAGVVL